MNITIDSGLCRYTVDNISSHVFDQLKLLYLDNACDDSPQWVDYSLNVTFPTFTRRFIRKQCVVEVEGQQPFNPVSPKHLLPSIEWSLNWSVAAFEHTKLIFHSSVVAKNGVAIMFPATSGSGKTTLATYLGAHGWQMFSDELTIIDPNTTLVNPIYRPSSLKNESINIIRDSSPGVYFSEVTQGTHKGDIAHVRLYTPEQFSHFTKTPVKLVVFPKFKAYSDTTISEINKTLGFATLIRQSFNYNVLGQIAFSTLSKLANEVDFYHVTYSDLADFADFLDELIGV